MQQTIRQEVRIVGVGLHTGYQVRLTLKPAPAGTGIVFRRVDLQNFEIEARRLWVSRVVLATTLMKRGVMLSTVEHLLSALYGLGIDNVYVEVDSLELPILDGSALPFVQLLQEVGVQQQDKERIYLKVEEPLVVREGEKFIALHPADSFRISYTIEFAHPAIGTQVLDLEVTPRRYAEEIAFARTFGFREEVEQLLQQGLIRGGSFENAVVLGEEGVLNGPLRAPDEFVRHKVLDLIGDIALCGYPILGHVKAYKAGHALHTHLALELERHPQSYRLLPESQLESVPAPRS